MPVLVGTGYGQRGFTLIELIVVLLIMSLMLAISAPRLAGRNEAALLRAGAADLQALTNAARAKAVLQGRTVALLISDEGQYLRLVAEDESQETATGSETRKRPAALVDLLPGRQLPEGISARFQPEGDSDPDLIRFQPDGSADGGIMRIVNRRDSELLLRLSQPLGRLRLMDSS